MNGKQLFASLTMAALAAIASSGAVRPAQGQDVGPAAAQATDALAGYNIYALTVSGNNLLRLNSAAPGGILDTVGITGLQAGETVLGIDFRPATGQLVALGGTGALYTVNTTTGVATLASTITSTVLNGSEFGVDFNPTVDRLRVVSSARQNLRINVDTGATIIDGTLTYTATDVNAGATPNVVGAAYTNNFTGATSTTLYVIDSNLDILATQNPPNAGALNTVGKLGLDVDAALGFDIASDANVAYAALKVGPQSELHRIDLTNGTAMMIGVIGGSQLIRDIAIAPSVSLVALTTSNKLLRLDSDAPGTILSSVVISGLQSGETVLGIDYRPAGGQLYALGSTSRVYTIELGTGNATAVGTSVLSPTLNGAEFGFDFNPTVDRIRVTSDADQNLRLHPITGTVVGVDGTLAYAVGDLNNGQNPSVVGAAYTNNTAGVTTTVLYGIDSNLNVLITQSPPNSGTLNTVGVLGVDTSELVGFDIQPRTDRAFASLTISGTTSSGLYVMNLNTGKANLVGTIGGSETIRGLAVLPTRFIMILPLISRDSNAP